MEQRSQSQVKAPRLCPIFLPALMVGNFEPKELALIFALQGYGANTEWVEITYADLSSSTQITKGALPLLVSKLQDIGIVERKKTFDKETGRAIYHFRLYIWEWAEAND